eukprot:1138616-Pelagomonas_calceolata.AAC.4
MAAGYQGWGPCHSRFAHRSTMAGAEVHTWTVLNEKQGAAHTAQGAHGHLVPAIKVRRSEPQVCVPYPDSRIIIRACMSNTLQALLLAHGRFAPTTRNSFSYQIGHGPDTDETQYSYAAISKYKS